MSTPFKGSDASVAAKHPVNAVPRRALLLSVLVCVVSCFCRSQTHNIVCSDGYDKFEAKFTTGVTVSVGAARNGKLARRTCEATLRWDKQDLVVVPEAAQVDIDVLGVDLGLGVPVVAFQMKEFDVAGAASSEAETSLPAPLTRRPSSG